MTLSDINTKSYPDSYAVLETLRTLGKDIYMFGGVQGGMSLGSLARDFLDQYGIEIKAHIANRAFIRDNHFRGKPIIALEEWQGSKDVAIIIGMADVKAKAAMLKELGFSHLYFLNAFRDFSYLKGCTEGFEEFFTTHLSEFEATYSLLADERSREVMKGYLQDRIYNNYDTLARTLDSKGFFSDVLGLREGEVMLDCGAYDGDTCLEFARLVPQYGHIYALEPDTSLYPKLVSNTRKLRCTPIPKGASDRACTLYFKEEVSGTTHLSHSGEGIKIECDTIDNLLQQERERETA